MAALKDSERMRYWLARAAMDAREEAGRIQSHIAAELGRDQSTVARFEEPANPNRNSKKGGWPRDVDETVAAYARDLEIDPRELWVRAILLWIEADASSEDASEFVQAFAKANRRAMRQTREGQDARDRTATTS